MNYLNLTTLLKPLFACRSLIESRETTKLATMSRDFSQTENVRKYWDSIDRLNQLRTGNGYTIRRAAL